MQTKTFEDWMKKVDAILVSKTMLSSADLPDICYADLFEDGCTPGQAARRVIRSANGLDE